MNVNFESRTLIFHPFMFSCLPILFSLAFNAHEISVKDIFGPIIISVIIAFIFWIGLRHFVGGIKSGLFVSLIVLLFVIYGNTHTELQSNNSEVIQLIGSNLILGTIFLIAGILGIILVNKTKSLKEFNSILNVIAITIIGVLILNVMLYYISTPSDFTISNFVEIPITISDVDKKPDVFFFILDEFAGEKQLEMDFDYDISPFKKELENRNFFVPYVSFSNYPNTVFSLPSVMNMMYMENLIEEFGPATKDKRFPMQLHAQNNVMKIFKSQGYKITTFYNGLPEKYIIPDSEYVDERLCGDYKLDINHELKEIFIGTYLPITIFNHQLITPRYYDHDDCMFSYIQNYESDDKQPHFIHAHFSLPHLPYRYDSDGNPTTLQGKTKSEYISQLIFTEKKTLELIDSIQNKSPETIIIIISDHGFRNEIDWENPTNEDLLRGFNNISALYFPNKDIVTPEKLSLVNIFRIFFNEYFDAKFEILEDRYIWYQSNPFFHFDATNEINALIEK